MPTSHPHDHGNPHPALRPTRRALLASTTVGAAAIASSTLPTAATAAGTSEEDKSVEPRFGSDGYTNPVIDTGQPDPGVIRTRDGYYLYSTNDAEARLPIFHSKDLVEWEFVGNGMPDIAPWCESGKHWAPEVLEIDGRYHVYYSAREIKTDTQAIGVATSDTPEGIFVDESTNPMISQAGEGGCIDASPFRDRRGQLWLLWKNDGNAADMDSYIYVQRMSEDGMHVIGGPTRIISMDKDWEVYTIEGPSVIEHRRKYYLFYSAGEYWKESYGVGCAVADAIDGPWTKLGNGPILAGNDVAIGPGHGMPIRTGLEHWYIYHAWQPDHVNEDPGRQIWLSHMTIKGDSVQIDGPLIDNDRRPPKRLF